MIIFYFLSAIFALLVLIDKGNFLVWATFSKFFIAMTFVFCFQYTSEIYPTKLRTTGLGYANGIGRLGGIFMPWVPLIFFIKLNNF